MNRARAVAAAALLTCAVGAIAGLWLHLVAQPDCTDRLRDDAFYTFVWARNLASGHGPTVSSGTSTSGVQWLWAMLLAAVQALRPDADALPRTAAAIGLGCHLLAAASWVVAGHGRPAAWCIGLLWLGNPLLLRECTNGQETALACLLLVLLWLLRRRAEVLWLPLAVLTGLARTDLLLCVLLLSLTRHGRAWWRGLGAPALTLLLQTALALACGGSLLQDSGPPMAWLFHANFAATAPDLLGWLRQQWWYTRPVLLGGPWATVSMPALGAAVFLLLRPNVPRKVRWLPLLLVGLAALLGARDLGTAVIAALLLARWPRAARRSLPRPFAALALGLIGILVLHWAVRWYPRDYYLAPLAVLATAAAWRLRRAPLLLLLIAAAQLPAAWTFRGEDLRGQEEMQMAGRFVDRIVPRPVMIGCFNSGIVTWYRGLGGGDADVVNLDGVVDHRALRALQQRRLSAWLDQMGVACVLDNPIEFELDPHLPHACGRWFGSDFDPARDLVELARFDVPGVDVGRPQTDSMRLYWRRRCGEPPSLPLAAQWLGWRRGGGGYLLWPATKGAVLETEAADGSRSALLTATADTAIVVAVPAPRLGSGRLFERGRGAPLLTVPGL